jgi:hypothetical protein
MLTTRLQVVLVVAVLCLGCHRAQSQPEIAEGMDDVLQPYIGPTSQGVDMSTLEGKIMCGYQGWFACEGDSLDRGWYHYNGRNGFRPGSCSIDLWPDMSELGEDERFDTEFRHADGSVAQVYSAQIPRSVDRHFEWMAEYGIDGAFVQRFAGEVAHSKGFEQFTKVLANCRAAANNHGRAYALMYDLSGLPRGGTERVIEDFKTLVDRMGLTRDTGDKAYLHHGGKPVVAVWGIGFNDRRQYTLEECGRLIDFLKSDPEYGGCTVMIGVPTFWRELRNDALNDPALHEVALKADIISPWMVGRFGHPNDVARFRQEVFEPDMAWCAERGKDYLPVVFPGFSWRNLQGPDADLGAIPRRGGRFLWAQYAGLIEAGATMIYQAMFDEVDEGTAIFKCTNDPPVGESPFLTYGGRPTDHYLWLVGQAGRMLRGEIPFSMSLPHR